jgi:hypothetical protein
MAAQKRKLIVAFAVATSAASLPAMLAYAQTPAPYGQSTQPQVPPHFGRTQTQAPAQVQMYPGAPAQPQTPSAEPDIQWTGFGTITEIVGGWINNAMLVAHSQPQINPGHCVNQNGYGTNPADPGVNLFHTMLLSAFMNRREVNLLISAAGGPSGCPWGQPHLIAVDIR